MSMRPVGYKSTAARYTVDVGFQKFMMSIYRFMTMGLGITGIVAFVMANLPPQMRPLGALVSMLSIFGTLGISLYMSFAFNRLTVGTANVLFWVYSVLMGMGLHMIFARYSMGSLASVFLVTSLTFGVTTAYAHVTKRDLTSLGSLLFMGLIGLGIAGLVNMFFHSPAIQFACSVLGCFIFTGLIAYDTQRLKEIYYRTPNEVDRQKYGILGALNLYMSVINLFLSLLNLLGEKKK